MDFIQPIPSTTELPAIIAMRELMQEMIDERQRRISIHQRLFAKVWRSQDYTASEALQAMGTQAVNVMTAAAINLEGLAALAAMAEKTLKDYISVEDYTPPLLYESHPDGTITII